MTATNVEAMMRRIAALIAKADSTEFPEEAKSLRAKAEELLTRYRIEESDLISSGELATTPVSRKIDVTSMSTEFRNDHYWMWQSVARHCGLRSHEDWGTNSAGIRGYVATAVGYDVDIRLAEMIFQSALLVFGQHLEPEVDPKDSDAVNVYRLRSAGIPRNQIARLMWCASLGSDGAAAHAKAGRLYKEECERRGEDATVSGRAINATTYRKAYAKRFSMEFSRRLREARDAADSVGGGLVLVGRAAKVDEAFYTLFPAYRPTPEPEGAEEVVSPHSEAKSKGLTKAQLLKIEREYYGPAAKAASAAAVNAVAQVRLDRTNRADRLEERTGYGTKEISR